MIDIGPNHWKDHFDQRFRRELAEFSRIIDREGEGSLTRALNKFNRWEEAFDLIFDATKNSFDVVPKNWGEEVALLPTGLPAYIDMWAMGKNFKVLPYLKFQVGKFLLDFILANQLEVDCVVEIGSGWGRNLFDLWNEGISPKIDLFSAENSKWGHKITRKLSALDPKISVKPVSFDIQQPDFNFLTSKKRILYFTHFAMMYVSELDEEFFEEMLRASNELTCIHLEPMNFQISSAKGHVSLVQSVEASLRNFNRNLLDMLSRLESRGFINLTHVYKELIPTRDRAHSMSVFVWKKI